MSIEKIEKMPDGNYRIVDVEVRSWPYLLSLRQQLQGLTAQAQVNVDLVNNNLAKIEELIASEKVETSAMPSASVPEEDALAAAVAKK